MNFYPRIPYSICRKCRFSNICPTLNDSYRSILMQTRDETSDKIGEILEDSRLSAGERFEKFNRILEILSSFDAQDESAQEWE